MSQNNHDLHNSINPIFGAMATVTDNTAVATGAINRTGYGICEFLIVTGTLADADATFATTVTECATSGGSYTAVAAADLIGTLANASFDYSSDNKTFKIGYKGTMPYVKCTVTPSNNTGSAPIGIIALLAQPDVRPTSAVPA